MNAQHKSERRILGIDPGTRIAGYGIIDIYGPRQVAAVAAGCWQLEAKKPLYQRLGTLAVELRRLVDTYKPTHLCLELSFIAQNPHTALALGHARGVILSESYLAGLVVGEMSATAAKKMVSGHGRADKSLVAKSMSSLLGFELSKLPFDATDALALAYAYAMLQ